MKYYMLTFSFETDRAQHFVAGAGARIKRIFFFHFISFHFNILYCRILCRFVSGAHDGGGGRGGIRNWKKVFIFIFIYFFNHEEEKRRTVLTILSGIMCSGLKAHKYITLLYTSTEFPFEREMF